MIKFYLVTIRLLEIIPDGTKEIKEKIIIFLRAVSSYPLKIGSCYPILKSNIINHILSSVLLSSLNASNNFNSKYNVYQSRGGFYQLC